MPDSKKPVEVAGDLATGPQTASMPSVPSRGAADAHAPHGSHAATGAGALAAGALGALGVVFGDIGTSPLYTLKECTRGAGTVGKLFGPVMVTWFVTIAVLGVVQIVKHPSVLQALSPLHAVHYFTRHGFHGFPILGSVVLAVTGGEALYADMGHFGARP